MEEDTIVAVATPAGRGARGIVRLSGPRAVEIVNGCLTEPIRRESYVRLERRLRLPGTAPFPVVVYVMRAPRSYTREDSVEVHAPGAPSLLSQILAGMRRRGARLAEPGEFTRRAFLNGRIDLAQAEAVLGIVRARNEAEDALSLSMLRGDLSGRVREARGELLRLAADVEAGLDFLDEEIDFAPPGRCKEVVERARERLSSILESSSSRRVFTEEVVTVLFGPANAGKSSVFNMLAGRREAIVEELPGTTRDFLEARVRLEGADFLLVDTAGVRPPAEVVEEIAVACAREVARRAQLVLFVVDASEEPGAGVPELYEESRHFRHVVVLNKLDRGLAVTAGEWRRRFGEERVVEISAATGEGAGGPERALAECVFGGRVDLSGSRFLLEERQRASIEEALAALGRARSALEAGVGEELVSFEVREAAGALGRVTGEEYLEDLLDEVFSRFCVGK